MKFRQRVLVVAVVAILIAGLAAARRQTTKENGIGQKLIDPATIQGCYELGTLKWTPDLLKDNEDEVFIVPPKRIRITADPGADGLEKNGYLVRPAPGSAASVHRFTYWMPTGRNAIEIIFSTGTSGLSMELKWDGTMLRGKAKTFWDFLRRGQTARIVAPKVDCNRTQSEESQTGVPKP